MDAEPSQQVPSAAAPKILDWLRSEPAIVFTLGYLLLLIIGGSYRWLYYRYLGLNAFDFAQVTDVLQWAFQEPVALLLTLASLTVMGLTLPLDRWLLAHSPCYVRINAPLKYSRGLVVVLGSVMYFAVFMNYFAERSAARVLRGEGEIVTLTTVNTGTLPPGSDGAAGRQIILIGQTSNWLIGFLAGERRILAIPLNNVGSVIRNAKR